MGPTGPTGATGAAGPTGATGAAGSGNNTFCADATGSTTTYTCPTPSPTVTTLTGLIVSFKPQTTNTGTSTLNVAALGAKTLKAADGSTNIASGALVGGTTYVFSYDGTNLVLGSSSGTGGSGSNAVFTTTTFSATPTFTVTASSTPQIFKITLTGNITSSTLTATSATAGQEIGIQFIQDATGGRTVVYPANFLGGCTPSGAASVITTVIGVWDGANVTNPTCVTNDAWRGLGLTAVAFSNTPTCTATLNGSTSYISDSTTTVLGATITGSGSNVVEGICKNGTGWIVGAGAASATPQGSCGGDLGGTYPNCSVNQIESAAIPTSAHVTGTNSSKQLVAATAADISAINYVAGGGTANAQTATYSPAVAALANGLFLCWLPTAANSTTTPTFAPNGLTAKTLVKVGAAALAANDLTTTAVACAVYDGTNWELQNPQTTGSGVTSVTGTSPIVSSGGATPAVSCATCVVASSPGAGVAHFAGSTQTVTSSAVTSADATGNTSGSGNFVLVTSPTLVTPVLGAATATSLLATGNIDGTAPITATTGTTATLGGTFKSGYTFNQEATAATAVAYTLPTAAAGLQYCIGNSYNGSAATTGVLTLNTSASGQFIIFTDGTLSATGGNITSGGAAADAACVVGVDSTHWQLYVQRGTWTKH